MRRLIHRGRTLLLVLAALLPLVPAGTGPAQAAEIPFGPQKIVSTSEGLGIDVVSGDLDGDGDVDLVASGGTNSGSGVYWYENLDGAATFSPARPIGAGELENRSSIELVDMDQDGDLDLLSGYYYLAAWYPNDGQGNFGARTVIRDETFFGAGYDDFTAADLDGDGDPDVVGLSGLSFGPADKLVWFRNNGGGTFNPATENFVDTLPNENGVGHVFPADLDGDGDIDLVATQTAPFGGDNRVVWYRNTDGAGTFSTKLTISTATQQLADVAVVDVDGDGDRDVVSADYGFNAVRWHENTAGDGSAWADRLIDATASVSFFVTIADMDLDGDPDVLVATRVTSEARWIENTAGDGSAWTNRRITGGVANPAATIAADLDGDGDLDVATASVNDNKIAWNENRTIHRNAVFPVRSTIGNAADGAWWVAAADVDGDGDMDALSASLLDDKIAWYESDGAVPPSWTARTISTSADGATSVFAADVDGDGDVDVLSSSQSDNKIAWYENDGASPPAWTARTISTSAAFATSVFAADVDGDGDVDALSSSLSDNKIAWYENDGASPPAWTARTITTGATFAESVFAADVDGDGDVDALSASLLDDKIAWYENNGATPPVWTARTISTAADGAYSVFATDLDGDGDVDVLSSSINDDRLAWYESNGASPPVWTPHTIAGAFDGAQSISAADVDGDGDVDVLSGAYNANRIVWFENNGATPPVFTPRTISTAAVSPSAVFAADMNGDGRLDVLASSATDDTISWFEDLGGQYGFSGTDLSTGSAYDGEVAPLLAVSVQVNGRPGDSVGRLATLNIRLESGAHVALSSAEANALFDELRIYRDDGNGAFDAGQDILVATVGTLSLTGGVQTVTLPASDPNVRVAAPATFFVVPLMATNASAQAVNSFFATHLAVAGSTVVDASAGVPLAGAATSNVATAVAVQARPRFVVNSFADAADAIVGDGLCATAGSVCSLRAAIQEANALAGVNRIVLGAGTYALTLAGTGENAAATGDLDVTDTSGRLTLSGQGADLTIIDGNGLDRVFHVLASAPFTLENVKVIGGVTSGAGVRGAGLLTDGANSLTIRRCDFSGNTSASSSGAALRTGAGGIVNVDDSVFHGNSGFDGGVVIDSGAFLNLTSSTVSGNTGASATSVAIETAGATNVTSCTITGNQGGLRAAANSITIANSIVAGNPSAGLTGDDVNTGTFTSGGHNLIGESASGAFVDGVGGNKVGTIGSPLGPGLGPLGDFGGPTLTLRPLAASPAVDAGNCNFLLTDQRGVKRPIDVAGIANASDGCDIGAYELESGATLQRVEVPVRWCGLRGSPSIDDPSLMGAANVNDLLRRRHEAASENIYTPQGGIVFGSAANFLVENYPLLPDPDCVEGPPGTFTCARGQRGEVYIDPAAAIFDEFEQLIASCRQAWQEQDPTIQGITAVQIDRFVDKNGVPLSILGIGGRAQEGDAREQAEAGRVAVVDHFYRQAVPGNPSPPNPSDTIDRLLGHELGHALSLRHGDGLDNDGDSVIDDDDEAAVGLPRFDGDNIMQYRSGTELSAGQVAQARSHLAAAVPDVVVRPFSDAVANDAPIDPRNASILEFGFDGVLSLANARILEFRNASILEFENDGVVDFANARILEFKNANILEFKNANILEFGMSYDGEAPAASTRLHATTAALPWPPALRPTTRYFFYLDADRNDATGAYPASKVNPSVAPNRFPGSNNVAGGPDVSEEAGVDLIAEVELDANCPASSCTSSAQLRVYDYDDAAGVYVQVLSSPSPSISAVGIGLYVDNGGAPVDLESAPTGITVQPSIPNSLLFAAGWGFTTPPGGGAPVPDRVRMEVVTTIECSGEALNDDPSSGVRNCQCTSCASCPDYPGCTGASGTPQTLAGTTILTDHRAGELTFEPPVFPMCAVIPHLAAEGQAVTVYVTDLPTDLAGTVVAERGATVIGSAPTSSLAANGSVGIAATLPAGALGEVTLSAGIAGYAPRAQCAVTITPVLACSDNDADGTCDGADPDDDNDGVPDGTDSASANPLRCRDVDADGCDDCATGIDAPASDGPDYDLDGLCDRGDPDDDNDGVLDAFDADPFNPSGCGDSDRDLCDDCSLGGGPNPAADGADADADGSCDRGDCRPLDASAFATPAEVVGVRLGAGGIKDRVSWSPVQVQAGSSTVADVLRGTRAGLPVGSGAEVCLATGIGAAQYDDATTPSAGATFWYLVRARNVCGTGGYGTTRSGVPRTSATCP